MPDYVTLYGAEAVERAGRQMAGAASDMQRAANQIDGTCREMRYKIDELIQALERWQSKTR